MRIVLIMGPPLELGRSKIHHIPFAICEYSSFIVNRIPIISPGYNETDYKQAGVPPALNLPSLENTPPSSNTSFC